MKIYCGGHLTTNNATTAIVIGNKQFSTSLFALEAPILQRRLCPGAVVQQTIATDDGTRDASGCLFP